MDGTKSAGVAEYEGNTNVGVLVLVGAIEEAIGVPYGLE